ncbi:hypothetical protein HS088_TW09G00024 [Tripterygium wilfordii]|uniref:Uncharacterized protein n=1 Tax=Tripterygium wilfordii TaxID=458696 RepID=A0A7J7D6J7_TRIWF|nr:hypothetical protein HS088_TW09G00024 [Tripterygium wilfordii]
MAKAWKRINNYKQSNLSWFKALTIVLFTSLSLLLTFLFLTSKTTTPNTTAHLSLTPNGFPIPPFNCQNCPQSHPVIANIVENVRYPFLYSLADFGNLPDQPHKNIVRLLKGKLFRKSDISITIQEVLEKMRGQKGGSVDGGFVVDVGANVGMASFAAAAMGFRVLAFDPAFENLQRICDGIWFNRVAE